jgi:phospholipase C
MDRRTFVKAAAAGIGATALGANKARAAAPNVPNVVLPLLGVETTPARTPVKHLVVVMMENRSVDHYLGWYSKENPAFDGTQTHRYVDRRAGQDDVVRHTESWGAHGRNDYNARFFKDPDHGWKGGRYQRNGGSMDQWLGPGTHNDEFALSYYDAVDVPLWAQLTRGWQAYDRWFCAVLGPTQPNRYYLYSGQSGGLKDNTLPPELAGKNPTWLTGFDWPTIWDLCAKCGVTTSYYFSNLPETAFWGARHLLQTRHVSEFYAQCATGTLPQLSIIDPWFTGPSGIANDDHPLADIRLGQAFLSDIVEAFTTSPQYHESALVITYDEWGGFWDHVPPPRTPDALATDKDPGGQDDFGQLGFRIPSTIISPWTRGHGVDHTVYNHASILRFACDNWGMPYLTKRIQGSNSIQHAFGRFRSFDPHHGVVPYTIAPDVQLQMIVDAASDQLQQGKVPQLIPTKGPVPEPPMSDLHRLLEIGWFDKLKINIDHRFEDGFLRPSTIVDALSASART